MKKYQVRVNYDKSYETLKEFTFETEEEANSFFDKTIKRAERLGSGTVAMFCNSVWLIKRAKVQ